MTRKNGRHMPAFLLLFLAQEPLHGAALLSRMEHDLPFCFADSAGLYRALQSLEAEGLIHGSWENLESGAPRKIYAITPEGMLELKVQAEDLRQRQENIRVFFELLESLQHKERK